MSKLKAKAPESVGPGHSKILLFGRPGSGKTWLSLSFPKPYLVDTEGGASLGHYLKKLKESGGAYLGPEDGSCDFDTIIEEIKTLATEKHDYKTLVIDSITKVFQMAIATEAERLGAKDAFGASKKPAVAQMRRLLNWISKLDMNVVFVAHETTEWGLVGGQRQEVGKTADVWDKLIYELHLALRIEHVNKGIRNATVVKSRLTGFPEFERIPLQEKEADVGYENFASRYGKDYIEADAKPVDISSPEQVAEITRLVSVLKIEEGEVDKWLTKANADSFADLTAEQADKLIAFLQKKIEKPKK